MTSHLHPAISPAHEAIRAQHLRKAAVFSAAAERNDIWHDVISGNPRQAELAAEIAARAAKQRRWAAQHLTEAARLTDWRDELDKRDSSWAARLCHLVEAPRTAHFT